MARKTEIMSRIKVREMAWEDLASILDIEKTVTGMSRSVTYAPAPESSIGGELDYSVVAEDKGKVIGFVLGRKVRSAAGPEDIAWIDFIGILPEYQGRSVGTAMLGAWKELCRQKGIRKAHIMISRRDSWMQSFFRASGFSEGDLVNFEAEIPQT